VGEVDKKHSTTRYTLAKVYRKTQRKMVRVMEKKRRRRVRGTKVVDWAPWVA
jgi:hypothetical protein